MITRSGLAATILIVEDEPDVLLILRSLVRELARGFTVIAVSRGAEALAEIAIEPAALVITDYNMPGMNGLELTRQIKLTSPQTHVVLVTAYATLELEHRAHLAGVDDFLAKPFAIEQLIRVVKAAL
jgi:CheY-like chemotaxis protein